MVATTPAVISPQEISLGGIFLKLDGQVRRSLISIIPGKLVIGDATRGDSQLSSAWTLADAKGGQLVERAIPSRDIDRSWLSTSEARYANAISLPPYVTTYSKPALAADASVIFEFNDTTFVAFGTSLMEFDEVTSGWVNPGGAAVTLPATPTDTIYYAGTIWIACGDGAALQKFNGTTVVAAADATAATTAATHLAVFDTVLYAMKAAGSMQSIIDTGVISFVAEGAIDAYLDGGYINGLFVYRDIQGSPVLYASTRVGLFYYAAGTKLWNPGQLTIPRHPFGGLGTCVYRGDVQYPFGLSTLKYNLTTISGVGLDRDDGLPAEMDGNIVAQVPGFNWLYVWVQSNGVLAAEADPLQIGWPVAYPAILPTYSAFSSLWATDGNGIWHQIWSSETADGDVTAAAITASDGVVRLWWCADGVIQVMPVPSGIHNPQRNPNAEFAESSWHITPWFDADWTEERKLAIRLRIGVRGLSLTERIRVRYGVDDDEGFAGDLGWVDSDTLASPTGVISFTFADGVGIPFYRIRFRFEFERTPEDRAVTPMLRFTSLAYLKGIEAIYGYDMLVDLSTVVKNQSPEQMRQLLREMSQSLLLLPFRYKDEAGHSAARIVRIVRYHEIEHTGTDDRGKVQLSLGEVYAQD